MFFPTGSNDVTIHREFGCFVSDAHDDPNFWRLLDGVASERGAARAAHDATRRKPGIRFEQWRSIDSSFGTLLTQPEVLLLHQLSQALEWSTRRRGTAAQCRHPPCPRELNPRLT